jgi:(p)ppGpp synthase/HD superfamily hydrolase
MMFDIEDIVDIKFAAEAATLAHKGQMRKDNNTPYIAHPARVAGLVTSLGYRSMYGSDLKLAVCVAWLHDVVEDTDVEIDDCVNQLYYMSDADKKETIECVLALTKNDSLHPRKVKMQDSIDRILEAPKAAVLVKICDRIDNYMDMGYCSNDFRKVYYNETHELYDALVPKAKKCGFNDAIDMFGKAIDFVEDGWD